MTGASGSGVLTALGLEEDERWILDTADQIGPRWSWSANPRVVVHDSMVNLGRNRLRPGAMAHLSQPGPGC